MRFKGPVQCSMVGQLPLLPAYHSYPPSNLFSGTFSSHVVHLIYVLEPSWERKKEGLPRQGEDSTLPHLPAIFVHVLIHTPYVTFCTWIEQTYTYSYPSVQSRAK